MSTPQPFTPPHPLNTAVLFLVFNRLDTTKQVFEAIRQAKTPRLYIAADGARETKEGEAEKVQAVRDYVMENIDWDCEVKTLFREKNLGCKYAVSGAITWFFENEEQGIILEDDCLPSQSFFWYCEELLNKYKNDETVYLISGDARGPESFGMKEDYGFCKYPMIWGWASWARVWQNYDPEISDWPKVRDTLPASISTYKPTVRFWKSTFEQLYRKEIDTWDFQFTYLLLKNGGKCIVPKINLISNVGFGADATHTFSPESEAANRMRFEIKIPLEHQPSIFSEEMINNFYDRSEFSSKSFVVRIINKLSRLIVGRNLIQ
ncbi:nucleotide-diphospho-sugar transferase [Pseudomonas sihuiensis]|uniref:Nucleotide-diphospho-sugar transferase n=1 Tax=Pseudomonas sihuiensis TaxID=1274359 RepID=A0A1H2L8V3_9PSED|nr:nucleotide-diphospho-sugar transferase [Pseudomonas sihuiensis]SDU77477.1 hypothetical protein SAMN05216363_0786 [Pseudomonas sihuiensis]